MDFFQQISQPVVGTRGNNVWQYSKYSFRKFDRFIEIWHLVYLNIELVQNLRHINILLVVWAQLFQENLGTGRLAKELEGTMPDSLPIVIVHC